MQAIIRRPVTIAMAMALGFATLSPASGGVPRRVVERSANVSARVISTRFIFKTEPGTNTQTPAITSGSGITQADWWLFAAQDDSTLVAVKGTDGALEAVRVFPSVDGSDRFSDVYGNKKLKPDLEAALTIPVASGFARGFGVEVSRNRPTVQAVLLVGSGSKAVLRDRMALIFPKDPVAESMAIPVQASALYEAMRREPALAGDRPERHDAQQDGQVRLRPVDQMHLHPRPVIAAGADVGRGDRGVHQRAGDLRRAGGEAQFLGGGRGVEAAGGPADDAVHRQIQVVLGEAERHAVGAAQDPAGGEACAAAVEPGLQVGRNGAHGMPFVEWAG